MEKMNLLKSTKRNPLFLNKKIPEDYGQDIDARREEK
jgi:hypothetical protein